MAEHLLHLSLLAQAWNSEFHYVSIPQGRELKTESFTDLETVELFELGRRLLLETGWQQELPSSLQRAELRRIAPIEPDGPGRR